MLLADFGKTAKARYLHPERLSKCVTMLCDIKTLAKHCAIFLPPVLLAMNPVVACFLGLGWDRD